MLTQHCCGVIDNGLRWHPIVGHCEMQGRIKVYNFFVQAEAWVYPKAEAWGDCTRAVAPLCCLGISFTPHEWASLNDIVQWANYFYISIKIQATILMQDPKSGEIAYKSIFLGLVGFSRIWYYVDVEIVFIP